MSSSLVKSFKFHYLNNKETDELFFSDDEDNDFNFKYIPASQFKYIVKDVKRQRTKQNEERAWTSFVQQESKQSFNDCHGDCYHEDVNGKQLMRGNLEEIDQELKRLEEDALPEQITLNDCETIQLSKKQRDNLMDRNHVDYIPTIEFPIENDDSVNSNTLLTIPEEDFGLLKCERIPIAKLNSTAKKKSRYEHTIKYQIKSPYLHNLDFRECNSDPEFTSPNGSNGSYDEIPNSEIRPHPTVAHKILNIQTKISELLDEIFYRLCHIPPPDGDIDLKRRQQRVMEFAIRFSRNYLYELGRQVVDIERHVQAISPNARIIPTKRGTLLHMQALEQKLCSAHQLLLNALSAYCKHIPSSILKGHPGKLKDILQIVIDIKDICSRINLTAEYFGAGDTAAPPLGKDTEKRCYAILSKLRLNSDNESPLFSHSTQSTLIGASASTDINRRRNQLDSRKCLPNRFSMYTVDSKHNKFPRNRRPVTVGVYLKEKQPVMERLPLTNPPPIPKQPHPSLITLKSGKKPIKRGRMKTRIYQKEDEIRTMMDSIPADSEIGSSGLLVHKCHSSLSDGIRLNRKRSSKQLQRERNTTRLATKYSKHNLNQNNDDNKSSNSIEITDKNLSSLIPVIADIMTLITSRKNDTADDMEANSVETFLEGLYEYFLNKNKKNKCQSIATSPGRHQDNSARKLNESPRTSAFTQMNNPTQEENASNISIQNRQENSMSQENQNCKLTQLVISDIAVREMFDYRNDLLNYQRTCRSSPMYSSNSLNKPWEVIAWIADKLVDELIVEISRELQMDDVIRKMFDLEFQEF